MKRGARGAGASRAPRRRPAGRAATPVRPARSVPAQDSAVAHAPSSPRWTASAKLLAGAVTFVLAGAIVVRFRSLIQVLIVAAIVAFLMSPIVRLIHQRARLPWRVATHLVFLTLLLLLIVGFTATGLALGQEVQSLVQTVQSILFDLPTLLASVAASGVVIGPFRIDVSQYDLPSLAEQALVYVRPLLGEASGVVTALAGGAIETIAQTIFVLAAAYFLTLDHPALSQVWKRPLLPGYEDDWARLRLALDRIWAAFLRGQIILAIVIAVVVTIGLSILGLRNALVLGLVAGLLEFLPIVGPFVAGAIAALVALFQGSNWWGLDPLVFTLVVIVFFIVIQQLENNLLVPRILGTALKLHPVVILVAAVIGATLAGILGILLSAPTVATLVVLGRYVYRKVFDLPPWDPPIDGERDEPPREPARWNLAFWRRRKDGMRHAG